MEPAIASFIEALTKYGVIPLFLLIGWAGWKGVWLWAHQVAFERQVWGERLRDALEDRDAWREAALSGTEATERVVKLMHDSKVEVKP